MPFLPHPAARLVLFPLLLSVGTTIASCDERQESTHDDAAIEAKIDDLRDRARETRHSTEEEIRARRPDSGFTLSSGTEDGGDGSE